MVDVHVCISPVLLSSSFLSSLIHLADLGNVSGSWSRGRFFSLSFSAGRCGAVCSMTQFLCSGGGTLGSKLRISVGLRLRTVGGLVSPGWVSTSSLVLPYFRRLTLLRGDAVVCVSVAPILACRVGSTGKGGRGGGGYSGVLAPVGPLLPDLLVLPSLSWLSIPLLPIWALISSIVRRVFLAFVRASRVSLNRSLRFALLLTSWSSRSCFINSLRKDTSSLRRGSGPCANTRWPEMFP